MTGRHIKKISDQEWHYPDHGELMEKCKMAEIVHYVEARRGTLVKYMEKLNPTLWGVVHTARPPAKNPNMILWWKQRVISKGELKKIVQDDEGGSN